MKCVNYRSISGISQTIIVQSWFLPQSLSKIEQPTVRCFVYMFLITFVVSLCTIQNSRKWSIDRERERHTKRRHEKNHTIEEEVQGNTQCICSVLTHELPLIDLYATGFFCFFPAICTNLFAPSTHKEKWIHYRWTWYECLGFHSSFHSITLKKL